MNRLVLVCLILFVKAAVMAQTNGLGSLSQKDFELQKYDLDSFSNAAILDEFGRAYMVYHDDRGRPVLEFEHQVRLKVFNSEGYGHAHITIPVYNDGTENRTEQMYDLVAKTINLVDGQLREVPLSNAQVFKEKVNKYWDLYKFTFPDLREGSIVEYRYRISSPNIFNFRTWYFQEDIPKVNSRYEATIPSIYNYNLILRGPYKLSTQDAKIKRGDYRIYGKDVDCSYMIYGMKDIPAFVEEDYMTAASNFKSAIYFELSDYYSLNGGNVKVTKEWKDVERELRTDDRFGHQLRRGSTFKNVLPGLFAAGAEDLDKAKAIYAYVQKQIKWNNYFGMLSDNGIKQALEKRSGNIGDINLALLALLKEAGLKADPVILSTRGKGVVNEIHPVLSDFNYVIAQLTIGEQLYYLDASNPLLPFGLLPLQCINGNARVVPDKASSYWVALKASQKASKFYSVNGKLGEDGIFRGAILTTSNGYAAYNKRSSIKRYNTKDDYIAFVNEQMSAIEITEGDIRGIDNPDEPLVEEYQIEMRMFNESAAAEFYFNPFFVNRQKTNPFTLDERTYPVDFGSLVEERVELMMELPQHYKIKSQPDNVSLALGDGGGRYLTRTELFGENVLNFSQLLSLNKSVYSTDEYYSLKELYSRIIQQEKLDIVLTATID